MTASNEHYADEELREILQSARRIAVVGASPNPERHSYRVMRYMQQNGYELIPVNPTATDQTILGETVYPSLAAVPGDFELVNVFRRSEFVPEIARQVMALQVDKGIRWLWLQLGIVHPGAAEDLRKAGVGVVMDRCLKIEYGRLLSHYRD